MAVARDQHIYRLFINGEFVEPQSGNYIDVINPAVRQTMAQVHARDPLPTARGGVGTASTTGPPGRASVSRAATVAEKGATP